MEIFIGTDHRGYSLKEKIKSWLFQWGYICHDLGAFKLDPQDDYPDFISKVAKKVSENPESYRGIILGASGQGEAVTANKYKSIRAVVYYGGPEKIIKLSKEHTNANILSLGASFMGERTAKKMIKLWLETGFSGQTRHIRRLDKIKQIEEKTWKA